MSTAATRPTPTRPGAASAPGGAGAHLAFVPRGRRREGALTGRRGLRGAWNDARSPLHVVESLTGGKRKVGGERRVVIGGGAPTQLGRLYADGAETAAVGVREKAKERLEQSPADGALERC